MIKNYAPKRIVGSWIGIPLRGWMSGTFVKAARNEDAFSMDVGAHGDVTVIQSHNATGNVVLTLQQSSLTNDLFSAKMKIAQRTGHVFGVTNGPLFIKDGNGTTLVDASVAWIRKVADVEYATEGRGREWTFDCESLEMHVGGALI